MKKETIPQLSYPLPPPPPPQDYRTRKKPIIGLILTTLGGIVIFVAAIVYLAVGNALAGILGIIFVVVSIFFARLGRLALEKKTQNLYGAVPMFIGLIVMTASGTLLNFDFAVIIGGFLLMIGGVFISTGK